VFLAACSVFHGFFLLEFFLGLYLFLLNNEGFRCCLFIFILDGISLFYLGSAPWGVSGAVGVFCRLVGLCFVLAVRL